MYRWEEAESDCNDAIIIDNRYSKAYARRGTARMNMSRYPEAIDGTLHSLFTLYQLFTLHLFSVDENVVNVY